MIAHRHLLEEVAKLQSELHVAADELAVMRQRLTESRYEQRVTARYNEALAHIISCAHPTTEKIGKELCLAAVKVLRWDSAYLIEFPSKTVQVTAGATQKQKELLVQLLSQQQFLEHELRAGKSCSTIAGSLKEAELLRALLNCDEVIAVPVVHYRKSVWGLMVGSHSSTAEHGSDEDRYLRQLAATIGTYCKQLEDK